MAEPTSGSLAAEEPPRNTAPTEKPEPEGGPLARQRAFLLERAAILRSREEVEAEEREEAAPAPPAAPGVPAAGEEDLVFPPDIRLRMVEAYRERQAEDLPRRRGPAAAGGAAEAAPPPPEEGAEGTPAADTGPGGGAPPLPPAPPPANNWIPIGPSVVRRGQAGTQPATSGRTPGIAVASGGTRVYAATANGGVWRSDDAGRSWRSLMDAWDLNPTTAGSDSLACGAIALHPTDPDRIYVGTGEGAGAAYFGVGPVFSADGGATWVTEPVAPGSITLAGSAFYQLAVDPGDGTRVVAATWRGVYRREPDGAGGFHWARKTLGTTAAQVATSVVAARTGTATTFYAARPQSGVFSSADGHSWAQAGTGFPIAGVGRIGLAVRPTDPAVVYALLAGGDGSMMGVWRLDTAGGQWRQISGHPAGLFGSPPTTGLQGTYDLAIAVDPGNANRIYLGGSIVLSGDWSAALYRCAVTASGSGPGLTYSMAATYVGNSVHGDVHTLAFAPADGNKLWVGCDGGVFYSTNPTGSGNIFEARNTGLQALTMNHLGQHPTEDAVVFCGTQDNGGVRFTGEEAWLYSAGGDGGFYVVNWNDPYRVLSTYALSGVRRSTTGGTRYGYSDVNVPIASTEPVQFYAPLVGTPPNPAVPAQAERVAFGSTRPWISDTFGGSWVSIPANSAADNLGSTGSFTIRSLAFASHTRLYVGLMNGRVYRFDQSGGTWTRTRIDDAAAGALGVLGAPVTDIVVDPTDATGGSIYVSLGGSGTEYRHVWRYNGTNWQQRSGPSAGSTSSLLPIQHNALVVDPDNPGDLYAAADIGIWRSTDAGATWSTFSDGLPDAAVLDLLLHRGRRLLRASTHGRGVFERTLDTLPKAGVELYVRDTQLDQGRFATTNGLPDPAQQGQQVWHWRGPDIKLDTPSASGQYQFPLTGSIDFHEFVDVLSDDFQNVATHATTTLTTRVYVQVHNRGVVPANNVRVMLLLTNASAGLPALPAGFDASVRNGTPITTPQWRTVGFATLSDVRVGFPRVAAFSLTSNLLPPPAGLPGNDHHCVLALVHHADDAFTSTVTHTDTLSRTERKAAHKNLKVVQFTGTLPPATPMVVPVRINNADSRERLVSVMLGTNGYSGKLRLALPDLRFRGELRTSAKGFTVGRDRSELGRWLQPELAALDADRVGKYDPEWAAEQLQAVRRTIERGTLLEVTGGGRPELQAIRMAPQSSETLFLVVDRPPGRPGQFHNIDIVQLDSETREVVGGITTRVEVVPAPAVKPQPGGGAFWRFLLWLARLIGRVVRMLFR